MSRSQWREPWNVYLRRCEIAGDYVAGIVRRSAGCYEAQVRAVRRKVRNGTIVDHASEHLTELHRRWHLTGVVDYEGRGTDPTWQEMGEGAYERRAWLGVQA